MSKEQFLAQHGIPCSMPGPITEDHLPVCLVDNGFFTAAGVGYCQSEVEAFQYPDGRPKKWFMVSRENLRKVSDLEAYE
jgi:hypothetical protein